VVGAGLVGAAGAEALAREGASVLVLDSRGVGLGVTGAGMGHLTVMDDTPEQARLSAWSRDLWRARAGEFPPEVEFDPCGTLWVAADPAGLDEVQRKRDRLSALGVRAHPVAGDALRAAEPQLAQDLPGGLIVPDDAVVYPPAAARHFLREAERLGAQVRFATVIGLERGGVRLADGSRLSAAHLLLAAGLASAELLPDLPLRPRKGHLVITDRHPGFLRHQVIELDYLTTAYGQEGDTVAFNAQPRPNGQVLLGSSRLYGDGSTELRREVVSRMVRRARRFLPGLGSLSALRAWTGLRPATPDKLPLIGPHPRHPGLWVAAGHEGLGVTNALGTARMIADLAAGRTPPVDPRPTLPVRFFPS
jgi:glycine/D-amino acid oxidase-like deaminating enzyme